MDEFVPLIASFDCCNTRVALLWLVLCAVAFRVTIGKSATWVIDFA